MTAMTTKDKSTGRHSLSCMEIWGGNAQADEALSTPGMDVRIVSRPYRGDDGGGDIHFMSLCGSGNIARYAIADVSGHGQGVSELASSLRGLMRRHINHVDQSGMARDINNEFDELAATGMFATALLATYFAPSDHLIVCNAGHPPPLWFRADTGSWEPLVSHEGTTAREAGVRNLPLGVISPTDYEQFAVPLDRGDIVILYTDALSEAKDASGKQLGTAGLIDVCRGLDASDPNTLPFRLLEAVQAYRADDVADDDETLIVLHHNAADPPKLGIGDKFRVLGRMMGIGE